MADLIYYEVGYTDTPVAVASSGFAEASEIRTRHSPSLPWCASGSAKLQKSAKEDGRVYSRSGCLLYSIVFKAGVTHIDQLSGFIRWLNGISLLG